MLLRGKRSRESIHTVQCLPMLNMQSASDMTCHTVVNARKNRSGTREGGGVRDTVLMIVDCQLQQESRTAVRVERAA